MTTQDPAPGGAQDENTSLQPGDAALVASKDGAMRLVLPEYGDDDLVPEAVLLLTAVFIRSHDPDWVEEMVAVLDEAAPPS